MALTISNGVPNDGSKTGLRIMATDFKYRMVAPASGSCPLSKYFSTAALIFALVRVTEGRAQGQGRWRRAVA